MPGSVLGNCNRYGEWKKTKSFFSKILHSDNREEVWRNYTVIILSASDTG